MTAFLDDLTDFVPKLLGAVAILIIGWIIARIIKRVVIALLKRLRFDEFVDRSGIGSSLARSGYPDSGVLLAKLIYFAVLLIALQLAINVFGESQIQDLLNSLIALLPKIAIAAIIVVITGVVANAVRALMAPLVEPLAARALVLNIIVAAIWVVGVFAAIDQIGVAEDITETLFQVVAGTIGLILVIKFGVGGIWSARDRFWPAVYDKLGSTTDGGSGASKKSSSS